LRTIANPIINPRKIDIGVVPSLLRIIVTNDLDKLAIARTALIGNDDFVVRVIQAAFTAETDATDIGILVLGLLYFRLKF